MTLARNKKKKMAGANIFDKDVGGVFAPATVFKNDDYLK
jgi:hypothetical protein